MATISTDHRRQHPSNDPGQHCYPEPFQYAELDEPLLALALSVQRGNWGSLTTLVKSMYGRLPPASENFPIPSQPDSPRKISPYTVLYKAHSPQARALMFGKSPPDRTEPSLWQNTIGPRITNVLLRMAKRSRLSGLEISAYLNMVLGDFFTGGQRTPKVAIEKSFGDFLMQDVPRDNEWENSVMKGRPRFLILGRGQQGAGYHWYVIIVDTDTKKAYCFDSRAEQDTRFNHIEAFAFLQNEWPIRLPQIPAPDQMIELPSFTRNDHYSSGFLCLYHVILLFRTPIYLRKLKYGDVIATKKHFDRVIKPAERYVGIEVEELTGETAPNSELGLNVNGSSHNGSEKKEASVKLKHHTLQKRPRKHTYKKIMTVDIPEETRSSLPNLSVTGNLDDSEPGVDSAASPVILSLPKPPRHKPPPVQYKFKHNPKGSTYRGILGWVETKVAAVDAASLEEPADSRAARARLKRKRGRGNELGMDTTKPKKQAKSSNSSSH